MLETQDRQTYFNNLPRKRNAVGVLVFRNGKILTLKTTYQNSWQVPGGIVEKNESLHEAAIRECKEETGLDIKLTSLLVVDYKPGQVETGDAIHFLFLGESTQNPQCDGKEIAEAQWLEPAEAMEKMGSHLAARIKAGLESLKRKQTVYCEDGKIIL